VLYQIIAWAGLACGSIPLLARPVLLVAQQAFVHLEVSSFFAALSAVILLFAAPVILLAMVGPFVARLCLHEQPEMTTAGQTIGAVSALSTLGSLIGTLLPVFVLVPWLGTERTLYLFAFFLLGCGLLALRDWRYLWMPLVVALLAGYTLTEAGLVRGATCPGCTVIAEAESPYNYIQVVRQEATAADGTPDPRLYLVLNEGFAYHSIYRPRIAQTGDPFDLLTGGGPWDYFMAAPYVVPDRHPDAVQRVAILGAAAGTTAKQLLAVYGADTHIDAVEIDPRILELAREYFALEAGDPRYPHYTTYAQDARAWLSRTSQTYDMIAVDAYRQPYVPFHLTTIEFFQQARARLTPAGVVVVNAARSPSGDDRLVNALASTMRAVFPQVFLIDTHHVRGASNVLLIGVHGHVGAGAAHFQANAAMVEHPLLQTVMAWVQDSPAGVREFTPDQADYPPFTDDHAPVEQLIDQMILDEARRMRE
jgi:hypothetical protein